MSAEVVNLRLARKRKAREDAAQQADRQRLKFGRTKAEKTRLDAEARSAARHLDGHRIEGPADEA